MDTNKRRIALVTGAASGIGQRIAERLALEEGMAVAVVDRDEVGARATAASLVAKGARSQHFVADLSQTDALRSMLASVDRDFGAPDTVVNNAGIAATIPAIDYPLEHWQLTLAINLTAPFLITQHVLRAMRDRGFGRIVNIASISGVRAGTGRVGYGTSKAALIAMTRQFAIESGEWGVTVNAVAPGPVDTPLIRGLQGAETQEAYSQRIPMHRYGTTDEIAHAVAFLVSAGASFVTGHTLAVDGGFLAGGLLVRDKSNDDTTNDDTINDNKTDTQETA